MIKLVATDIDGTLLQSGEKSSQLRLQGKNGWILCCRTKEPGCGIFASVLGISLEDVIAIGDNYNDLPMLAEVGHPWIMKNSALDQAGFGQSHEFLRAESVEEILKKL